LHGTLFQPGDFFPSPTPFNPIADTLAGISQTALGFRLGTVINLLALIWTAQVTDKLLRPLVGRAWLRAVCVLLVIMSEQLLFEISTYMVDLLTLPLMLEAILLTLRADEAKNRVANFLHIAILLGATTAFKITNLAVVLPVMAICAYQVAAGPGRIAPKRLVLTSLLAIGLFVAPQLPFSIYIFRLTGNPIFPLANVFFKSPYWPTHGGWDYRWGPQNVWETLVWPVMIWFKPERTSELAVYSGRISLGFVVAIAGLVFAWRNKRARTLCFILISSALLWSVANTGYVRYGLCQEILAGIVVVALASGLAGSISARALWRNALAAFLGTALVVQAGFACHYELQKEWGGRRTVIDDPGRYWQEASLILRDHSFRTFLTDEQQSLFDKVEVWLETAPKSSGFEVLANPRAPIIAVRQREYFFTREAWLAFTRVVEQSAGKKMFSLCLGDDLDNARQAIALRGLEVGTVTPLELPFFSRRERIGMMLIEVRIPREPGARAQFESAWMKGAFPSSVYREEIIALNPPAVLRAGEKAEIQLKVRNLGDAAWPARGTEDFRYQVNIGDRWLTGDAKLEDNRAVMSGDLPPGGETQMTLTVNAPRTPGDYILEIDMVHEGVTWFKEKGGRPLRISVHVSP
jgi:hypothetical protein